MNKGNTRAFAFFVVDEGALVEHFWVFTNLQKSFRALRGYACDQNLIKGEPNLDNAVKFDHWQTDHSTAK
jgi:hypothetical protein